MTTRTKDEAIEAARESIANDVTSLLDVSDYCIKENKITYMTSQRKKHTLGVLREIPFTPPTPEFEIDTFGKFFDDGIDHMFTYGKIVKHDTDAGYYCDKDQRFYTNFVPVYQNDPVLVRAFEMLSEQHYKRFGIEEGRGYDKPEQLVETFTSLAKAELKRKAKS